MKTELVNEVEVNEDITETTEVIEPSKMTKEELITTVIELKKTNDLYDDKINEIHNYYNKEINDMKEYYVGVITDKNNIIGYYERKFNLLADIIHIETGKEKVE